MNLLMIEFDCPEATACSYMRLTSLAQENYFLEKEADLATKSDLNYVFDKICS